MILTEKAKTQVRKFLEARQKGIGLRIGVKSSGCSGFRYVLEYIDRLPDEDIEVFEHDGFVVAIKSNDLVYFNNATLDWVTKGLNEGFEFQNPKESGRCGCGESFAV